MTKILYTNSRENDNMLINYLQAGSMCAASLLNEDTVVPFAGI